jgi:hypothetical protein
MKTEASQEHLRDKTQPHFSLKEMKPIPPYRGPKRVFVELMDEVSLKIHHFRKEVWNVTIELIADHLGLMENPWKHSLPDVKWKGPVSKPNYSGFQELKSQIEKTGLIEQFIKEAKESPRDYFGDIFTEEELAGRNNRLGQNLTPMQIVNFMVKSVGIGEKKQHPRPDAMTEAWLSIEAMAHDHRLDRNLLVEQQRLRRTFEIEPVWEKYVVKPQTALDPTVGTGRFLLGATWQEPKAPLVLFGIEIDLSLYRACLVNMALFSNHPYTIICADTLMIDQKYSGIGSKIWDFGNQWDPPDISQFYYMSIPPFKFSLKDLAKAAKLPVNAKPEVITPREIPAFSLAQLLRAKKKQS